MAFEQDYIYLNQLHELHNNRRNNLEPSYLEARLTSLYGKEDPSSSHMYSEDEVRKKDVKRLLTLHYLDKK